MTFVEPLNLQMQLVNVFAGGMLVFSFIAIAAIAYWSARFRMNNFMTGFSVFLFSIMMGKYFGWLYLVATLLGALAIGYTIARLVKQ